MDWCLALGRWMGPATATSSKGLWGGFAKQVELGVRGAIIQHERGSFQHLLSLSHLHPVLLLYSESRDEKETKTHECSNDPYMVTE